MFLCQVIHLSVNINKFATLRNSRGGNNPDILAAAHFCEKFGAHGITVHPRPDERHIRYADVYALKDGITTEFNIEGNPREKKFIELVCAVKPTQVTLVPDAENQLTSNHGWETNDNQDFLKDVIEQFKAEGIRVSLFLDANPYMLDGAVLCGADRIELYTEAYARDFKNDANQAVAAYKEVAQLASQAGLAVNAGHDLNLDNLNFFAQNVPHLAEVSIGHALVCDALYLGLENTIKAYLACLQV